MASVMSLASITIFVACWQTVRMTCANHTRAEYAPVPARAVAQFMPRTCRFAPCPFVNCRPTQETTMKLIPYLMFTKGQCREAFDFYAQALRGKVISVSTYGDMPGAAEHIPAGNLSRVANAHLVAAGASIMGSDNVMGGAAADSDEGRNDTTVNIDVESIEEAERVFAAMSA